MIKTLFRCDALALVFSVALFSSGLHADPVADPVKDAQVGLSKAYNDYYKALQSKPGFTGEDAARLSDQLVAPAQQAVSHAVVEQTRATIERVHSKKGPALLKKLGPIPEAGKAKGAVKAVEKAPAPQPEAPEVYHHPETVLDGSKVEREIEFPGPKKASPAPKKVE